MKNYILILVIATLGFSACKKETVDYEAIYKEQQAKALEQYGKDTVIINKFIADNNIPAVKDTVFDVYYQIIEPGTGTKPNDNSPIKVLYKGSLLNGSVFDTTQKGGKNEPVTFDALRGLIAGWRIGLPKIKTGGKIRLIIPSGYGYGAQANQGIPANSILDFEIELLEIQK